MAFLSNIVDNRIFLCIGLIFILFSSMAVKQHVDIRCRPSRLHNKKKVQKFTFSINCVKAGINYCYSV